MNMIPVYSSDIASVGYSMNTLDIQFNSGATYRYSNVPESIYRNLLAASSKGKYFHAHIKNSYTCIRIG